MNKFYAGIGSRKTPEEVLSVMTRKAQELDSKGFILRSGGAIGADSAFSAGSTNKEIYLPWEGFNDQGGILVTGLEILSKAEDIVRQIHPAFKRLSFGAKILHTRNVFQILGSDLSTPVEFVLFWCPMKGDSPTGGTATAVNLARKLRIPTVLVSSENSHSF